MRYKIVLFFAYGIVGCNSDYTHELPNEYILARIYSGATAIADMDSKIIVGPSKYGILIGVDRHYVVGNLDTEEKAFKVEDIPDRYFIVNTYNGNVYKELSQLQFDTRKRELGIRAVELKRPTKHGI